MQDCCCVIVDGLKIRVLRQSTRDGCELKLRASGSDGQPLDSESEYLVGDRTKLDALLNGHTIRL